MKTNIRIKNNKKDKKRKTDISKINAILELLNLGELKDDENPDNSDRYKNFKKTENSDTKDNPHINNAIYENTLNKVITDNQFTEQDTWVNICKEEFENYSDISVKSIEDIDNNSTEKNKKHIEANVNTLTENKDKDKIESLKTENNNQINKENQKAIFINKNKRDISEYIKIDGDFIIFQGFKFKATNRINNYKNNNNSNKIYKCIYNRHQEKERIKNKSGAFCNATISVEIFNEKKIFKFIKDHSLECLNMNMKSNIDINASINEYDDFKIKCFKMMDESKLYDRKIFKENMLEIYNSKKYNFSINNNKLNNMITTWRNNSHKFNKMTIFENMYDIKGNLILREYRQFFNYELNKKKPQLYEYIIWGNNEGIFRSAKSSIWFFDGTFHHPNEYDQLLLWVLLKFTYIVKKEHIH